ncbi:hypothetical protein, partial [Acinetobacter baumannii]|uniref:hypothetical protein n=1 Tax=Acinetobacter baumannii TaxID=470 RepID=UPI001E43C834
LKHLQKFLRMTDGVNYADLSREVLFKAFLLWLTKIGYRGIVRPCGRMEFYCATVSKLFPRNVHITYDGKMNKAATQLFKEFEKHLKA